MQALKRKLEELDPPLKHTLEEREGTLIITLFDPQLPAKTQRSFSARLLHNRELLYEVVRDAVNELRAIGAYPPLDAKALLTD
ncbi:hypothetical protein IQ22_01919 [Pseudomonas duriflava]|uniref:Uncharacterized protein n=1 Tax=Pseudomonas duriflava TaxID=459528 RepID=A0A562QE31_9PSED|nr:hypothetical protein [Pseudomonas duriflava]TWI55008.1 hypothetical protein IQ22_01919 [Pseudomonas duriflava]